MKNHAGEIESQTKCPNKDVFFSPVWIGVLVNTSVCIVVPSLINICFQTAPTPKRDYQTNFAQLCAVPLWLITAWRSINHFVITSDPDKSHILDDGLNHCQPH